MPRNGRIKMVGKREAREARARTEEMRELERALRAERKASHLGRAYSLNERYAQDGEAR